MSADGDLGHAAALIALAEEALERAHAPLVYLHPGAGEAAAVIVQRGSRAWAILHERMDQDTAMDHSHIEPDMY